MKKIILLTALILPFLVFGQQKTPKPKKQARHQKRMERKHHTAPATQPPGDVVMVNDKKAENILEAVSKKYKSYKSFQARFTYTLENKSDKIKESQNGTITTSGQKFRVEIAGQEIFCDGKIIYTYNKEANEVSVNNYSPKDADINPAEIFTMYQKGFMYRLVNESKEGENTVQNIELSPKDKTKTYYKVKVVILKGNAQIIRSTIYDKSGNVFEYHVVKQTANPALDANYFVFDKKKYPGVQVIDLR